MEMTVKACIRSDYFFQNSHLLLIEDCFNEQSVFNACNLPCGVEDKSDLIATSEAKAMVGKASIFLGNMEETSAMIATSTNRKTGDRIWRSGFLSTIC